MSKYQPFVFNGPEDYAQQDNSDAAFMRNEYGYLEYVGSFNQLEEELLLTRINVERFDTGERYVKHNCGCLEDCILRVLVKEGYQTWVNPKEGVYRTVVLGGSPTFKYLLKLAQKDNRDRENPIYHLWEYNDRVLLNTKIRKLAFLDEALAKLERGPKFRSKAESIPLDVETILRINPGTQAA